MNDFYMDRLDKFVLKSGQSFYGKYVLVTGATGSIGFEVARFALLLHAKVGITYRNKNKAIIVKEKLEKEFNSEVDIFPLDLSDIKQVKSFVDFLPSHVDYLFNVAGTYHLDTKIVDEKYELTYLSDFLSIANLNRTLLEKFPHIKIINTGSVSMYYSKVNFDDIMSINVKNKTIRYGRDKRLLALDTMNLQEKFSSEQIVLVHPGVSATSLFASSKGGFNKLFNILVVPLMKLIFMPPKKASLSVLFGAFMKTKKNELIAPRGLCHSWGYPKVIKLRKSLYDSDERKKLSEVFEQL